MASTLGIIEVPAQSGLSRPGLVSEGVGFAERRIGGKPLLEWVIRRVTDSLLLDRVTVLFDPQQEKTLRPLAPPDISVMVSHKPDALGRFAAACREFGASAVIRVRLDCPFVDPALIDRLVCIANAHPGCDYIGYSVDGGKPSIQSRLGVFAEWCQTQAIYQADATARSKPERSEVTQFIISHSELFQLRLIPVPAQLESTDLRLTISGEEDWENAYTILEALGPDDLDWQTIARLLNHQPGLRQRMADLNLAERNPESNQVDRPRAATNL
jgi:spore coat polysaccharide biosynthesis protein SpsF (cytidylyltransferase family)